jgi:hypothetical protein
MWTSANVLNNLGVISKEEPEEEAHWGDGKGGHDGGCAIGWAECHGSLSQTGVNGNKRLPDGQLYLIMNKGDANQDLLGQMGLVSRQTKCMVLVLVWKDKMTGMMQEKLKYPESLIQLEDGLRGEQDTDGMLWVVRGWEAKE